MDEEEYKRLKKFQEVFRFTQGVCDPFEFLNRQKYLLIALSEHLLFPLYEHEKKLREEKKNE